MQSDLATLAFANQQKADCEKMLVQLAAQDERLPWLIQLPGVSLIVGLTVLAAIGEITRFAAAAKLVGYAGLGSRVHDSGLTRTTGRITKAGRRELRAALVEAAQVAANTHPHWQAELARLEPRLGRNKAIVALARKLLVVMWHVLTDEEADRHAEPERVARKLIQFTYRLGKKNRRAGQRATDYVREQLDRLGVGQEVTDVRLGQTKVLHLPASTLPRTQPEA